MSRESFFATVTAVNARLYVLTESGDICRVTHLGVRPSGETVPVVTDRDGGFKYANNVVHMGTWLACQIARLHGAHIPKPEPETEHLDDARGHLPAAIEPLSVVPNHRRHKTTVTGKDNN